MSKLLSLLRAAMSQDMKILRINTKGATGLRKMLLPLAIMLLLMFSIGSYVYIIAEELAPHGLTYIILTMFILFTSILTLVEGVYKSQGILFEAKDNDLLFSLPIKKSQILFVRIFKLLAFQFLYNSLFMLPVIAVYVSFEHPGLDFYLISLLMLLLLPIIPTIIGALLGYIVKGISSRFKAKNILQVILTSLFLLLIFGASFGMQDFLVNITQNAHSINEVITKIYYPAGLYLRLIQNFQILDLLILLAINFIPAILFIYIASIFYFHIITRSGEKGQHHKKSLSQNSTRRTFRARSQLSGLVHKELKRISASPVLLINAGFGMVILIAITIVICINFNGVAASLLQTEDIGLSLQDLQNLLPKIFFTIVVFTSCMTSITSSLISLEGKSFNITKSLPVAPRKILLAKILASNLISIPAILLCDVIFCIVFKVAILDVIFIILASIAVPTFTALIGLLMNLRYPKMDASSDTEIVKQSMSATISVLIGMFVGMAAIALMIFGGQINLNLTVASEILLFIIVDLILWRVLTKSGVKKWQEINI